MEENFSEATYREALKDVEQCELACVPKWVRDLKPKTNEADDE